MLNRSTHLLFNAFSIFLILGLSLSALSMEPLAMDLNQYMEGKFVFERHCIICHGARGDGAGELGATLMPKPRSFREGQFKFRSTPYTKLPTEADLVRTIRGGLSGTGMGMFTYLSDSEVRSVISYLSSFSRRWRKSENYADEMKLPAAPAWMENPTERQHHAAKGKDSYIQHCAVCHGQKGDGLGPAAQTLKDIWNQPSKPSDLRQLHLRCGDTPTDIYRVLATGLNGTAMIGFEQILSPDQRWDVLAYLVSLKLPSTPILGNAPPESLQLKPRP